MSKWLLALMLIASPGYASSVIIYDPNDPDVTNAVKRFQRSVSDPDFPGPNVLFNPDLTTVRASGAPVRHWKVSLPDTVLEMTQAEKNLIDADGILDTQRRATLRARLNTLNQRLVDWDTMTDAQKFAAMKVLLQWLRVTDQMGGGIP